MYCSDYDDLIIEEDETLDDYQISQEHYKEEENKRNTNREIY